MLLKGLPRAQLFLPAWTARIRAFVQQKASKSSSSESNGESQPPNGHNLSLFEELFPEESKGSDKVKRAPIIMGDSQGPARRVESVNRAKSRESPTPYKLVKHRALKDKTPLFSSDAQKEYAQNAGLEQQQFRERQDAHVLVLSNASKSLALSDFLRLSPKGEHIDGWASGIIKGKYYRHNEKIKSNLTLQSSPAAIQTHSSAKDITSSSSRPTSPPENTWTNSSASTVSPRSTPQSPSRPPCHHRPAT